MLALPQLTNSFCGILHAGESSPARGEGKGCLAITHHRSLGALTFHARDECTTPTTTLVAATDSLRCYPPHTDHALSTHAQLIATFFIFIQHA